MKTTLRTILVLAAALLAMAGQAQAHQWELDKVHSNTFFDVQHFYSTVRGKFTDLEVDLTFEPDKPQAARIEVVVHVDSIDTGVDKRDEHLRSPDFFDAGKFPVMTFKSSGIRHVEGNRYEATGTLTIKDVTRVLTVPFIYHGQQDNLLMPGKIVAGLDARLSIDRLDYHVGTGKFAEMGVVGRNVDLLITLEMLRDK